jgi:hypothetical protein
MRIEWQRQWGLAPIFEMKVKPDRFDTHLFIRVFFFSRTCFPHTTIERQLELRLPSNISLFDQKRLSIDNFFYNSSSTRHTSTSSISTFAWTDISTVTFTFCPPRKRAHPPDAGAGRAEVEWNMPTGYNSDNIMIDTKNRKVHTFTRRVCSFVLRNVLVWNWSVA